MPLYQRFHLVRRAVVLPWFKDLTSERIKVSFLIPQTGISNANDSASARARAPAGYRQKGGQESREQTILNGKTRPCPVLKLLLTPFMPGRRRIQTLAAALRLPDRLADAGQRYFNLAVNMNFVQGRRTQYVVAACLYSACRVDKTSHMLIDFSDLLEVRFVSSLLLHD